MRLLPRLCLLLVPLLVLSLLRAPAFAAQTVTLGVPVSLTGFSAAAGTGVAEAAQMAADEANRDPSQPHVALLVQDDTSRPERAAELARGLASSDVVAVVGPGTTQAAIAAAPVFEAAGLAAVIPYAHGAPTSHATTFLTTFDSPQMGELLAAYLRHALGRDRAVVIFKDNGYGRPIAAGFRATAERLGMTVAYQPFGPVAEAAQAALQAALDPADPVIVLAMVDGDAAPVLKALARGGRRPTLIGTSAIASENFFDEQFKGEPEAATDPGRFLDGVYTLAPLMADSANADATRFVRQYAERYGHQPRWEAAQGYDATRLAIEAARAASAEPDTARRRAAVLRALIRHDSPDHAASSLTGPLWFSTSRNRLQAARVGQFHGNVLESAPIQLVPVAAPTSDELRSGVAVEIAPGRYARRQRVVYAGMFLNEVSRIDLAPSTFTADFYFWLRYAREAGSGTIEPTDIEFPDLVRGVFERDNPAEVTNLDDGTTYRLWRVRGEFRNAYDLHHYPLDRQALALGFVHSRAAADRLVFARDRRFGPAPARGESEQAAGAFDQLTQWDVTGVSVNRDIRVSSATLGDPRPATARRAREVNGLRLVVDVRRRVVATLAKSLLPLGLLTLIMFASLYFPHGLVKEKVTVAITAALSGAVLLSAINGQLGSIGYVIAVEYVFYIFFALALMCVVTVLAAERLRVRGRNPAALGVEQAARLVFVAGVAATAWLGADAYARW